MDGLARGPGQAYAPETSNAEMFEVHHVSAGRPRTARNRAASSRGLTETKGSAGRGNAMLRQAGKKTPRPSAAVARHARAQQSSGEKRRGAEGKSKERPQEAQPGAFAAGPTAVVEEDEAVQVWGTSRTFKVRDARRRSFENGDGPARRPSLDLSKVRSAQWDSREDQENVSVLGEVSARLMGPPQKKGVVAVKVREFSFADEALERAVPPPPRYPHQPRKKVRRQKVGQNGGPSRASSVWDEKSVRSFHDRPLSALPSTGMRVKASDWFRPESARGAHEGPKGRRSRLGRHVESAPAERPLSVADWLREQEELDSSGAELASESPRARALLASIRGPLSPNQTSQSYVQRLERMLVSLRGQLEGRGREGVQTNNTREGDSEGDDMETVGRTDGVFRSAQSASPQRVAEHTKAKKGIPDKRKVEKVDDRQEAFTDDEGRSTLLGDGYTSRRKPDAEAVQPVYWRQQPGEGAAAVPGVSTEAATSRAVDEGHPVGGAEGTGPRNAWPELSVREEDYRRALGIAPGWEARSSNSALDGEDRGVDVGEQADEVDEKGSSRQGMGGARKGAGVTQQSQNEEERAARHSRRARTSSSAIEEGARTGSWGGDPESGGGAQPEQPVGEIGRGRVNQKETQGETGGAAWRTGLWEHVAGPGMRGGPEHDVSDDVEGGDGGGSDSARRRRGSTNGRGERSSGWGGSGERHRLERTEAPDDGHSSASDGSRSEEDESPRWAERSRPCAGAERPYDSSAYEEDPGGECLQPNYYSDGEADQRAPYATDHDGSVGCLASTAPRQRPKSARPYGRAWQDDSPGVSDEGVSERSYPGGVDRVTFPGGVKGPYQLATEHSCHRNCVRYLGVPRGATVPQPFKFDERERLRGRSIAEKRTTQDRLLKDEVDWLLKTNPFKANPLPRSTVVPRYARLKAASERRRREVHSQSMELLRSIEKPFSFYNRNTLSRTRGLTQSADLEAAKERVPAFKANPVPAAVKEKKFDVLVKEMEAKKELRKRRALEELKNSRLPPRMEMHERAKDKAPRPSKWAIEEEASFKPHVKATVPDFDKLHSRFKASLESARAELPVTRPEAFSFFEKPSLSARKKEKIHQDIGQDEERLPEQRWPFMAPRTKIHPTPPPAFEPPAFAPAKTLAVKLKELKVKEEREQGLYDNREEREIRKAEQRKKEDQRRKALWESFQRQNGTRLSKSGSYRASRKKGPWRGWDGLSLDGPSSDMHRTARMKQEEERAREIVEQALMDNGLPFSLDEILDA